MKILYETNDIKGGRMFGNEYVLYIISEMGTHDTKGIYTGSFRYGLINMKDGDYKLFFVDSEKIAEYLTKEQLKEVSI